jgi:hypothetical protein
MKKIIWICITILSLVLAFWLGVASQKLFWIKSNDFTRVLQYLPLEERKKSYELAVSCEVVRQGRMDDENHTISGVRLFVLCREDDPWREKEVFTRSFDKVHSITWAGPIPVWGTGFIPNTGFILPSARLFSAKSKELGLVVYNGGSCQLLVFDELANQFVSQKDPREYSDDLKNLWLSSFALEDIYWCYALVTCGDFFWSGFSNRLPGPIRIDELYSEWKKMKSKLPSP